MNALQAFYDATAAWASAGYLPGVFEHPFMVRGLLAALILGPLLGGVGTLVTVKRLAFFTQTIGHASLTGVARGLLFGEPLGETYAGLYGTALLVALVMLYVRNRSQTATDTVVGVVLAQILGLGIVLLVLVTKRFDIHQVEAVLFGSLITLTDRDLAVLAVTGIVAALTLALVYNRAMLISFNSALARARGVHTTVHEYLFVVLLTVVVVASLKIIGAVLVLVLVVVPAAAAQNLAGGVRGFFSASVAFATLSAVSGLLVSAIWPIPTGGAIVLSASLLFYLTLLTRAVRGAVRQGGS